MLDKIDRKLLSLLQSDCTLSLQALADAVNLTTTPCWKRLKKLEDDGILLGRVALLDPEKLGLGLTAFVLIKTQHHSSEWPHHADPASTLGALQITGDKANNQGRFKAFT